MKYDAEVQAAIARWGPALGVAIDPRLVHAVIQRESSHGASLVTNEGGGRFSYGPMMVLDATARAYGQSPTTLKDPATGILWGVRYLADQLRAFPGDVARALSAYNTGPGRASRGANGKFPNQPYVDAVLGFWRQYGGAAASGAAVLGLVLLCVFMFKGRARRRAA